VEEGGYVGAAVAGLAVGAAVALPAVGLEVAGAVGPAGAEVAEAVGAAGAEVGAVAGGLAVGELGDPVGAVVAARIGAVEGVSRRPLSKDPNTDGELGADTNFLFSHSEPVTNKPDAYASAVQSRAAPVTGN